MDRVIAVVFDGEGKAYEGTKALRDLDAQGCISLYGMGVIAKDTSGKLIVRQAPDEGPLGTAVGLLTGSLIGLLGGPVGVAVGAYVGTLGGLTYDLATVGVAEDFLAEVGRRLQPGKTVVIAEIEEEWVTPIDSAMERIGGIVFRREVGEVRDALIERDTAALKAEIASLKAEYSNATGEAKVKLQATIDATKAKLQATQDRVKAEIETANKGLEAKVHSLHEQAVKAKGEAKAKLDTRVTQVQADYKKRSDKLNKAWELTKEALTV